MRHTESIRQRVVCQVCGRETALYLDGTLYFHYATGSTTVCRWSLGAARTGEDTSPHREKVTC